MLTSENNFKNPTAGCDIWGGKRMDLAVYLRDNILNELSNDWFIENGTLLGAWRNGRFIAHDDDFDIGILINSDLEAVNIYRKIESLLMASKYKCRLVNSYACKIEVFDEKYGKYILAADKYKSSDFHYVTLDIQFYLKLNEKEDKYESLYFLHPTKRVIDKRKLVPTTEIRLENERFNAPNNVEEFLKQIYGSLDQTAKFNPETGFYE